MEDIIDSLQEQGSTSKSKYTSKDASHNYSSSLLVSQSEEDSNVNDSEAALSLPDQKLAKRGRRRTVKAQDKNEESSVENDGSSNSLKGKGKSASKKHGSKTEQYKHKVIADQYGVFEYDKDPEGYKKARKRQQNRESALRARDKRVSKMETVETTLSKMQRRSDNLEKENIVLKAEKKQLEDQVKNLLSILTSLGQNKRFKVEEKEELCSVNNQDHSNSTALLKEDSKNPEEHQLESFDENICLSPKWNSPEKTMLKLMRSDNESIFEENSFGNLFQKGIMLSLTIVMWMILCLTGYSISENMLIGTSKMWTTCEAPGNPFSDLRLTESKSQMFHPMEPHFEHDEVHASRLGLTMIMNIWIGVFILITMCSLFLKKQQYRVYNRLAAKLFRLRH